MGWTDERVEVLKKLWLDGLSASQIAKQLGGGVTRNAVIGKVHRLGLSGRATPSKPARPVVVRMAPRPRPISTPAAPRRPTPLPTVAQPTVIVRREEPGSATVLTLAQHMCKWPIGDPSSRDFTFCGKAAGGHTYCADHAAIAYQPVQKKGGRSSAAELARSLRRYM